MVLTKSTSDLVCVGMEEVTVALLEVEEEEVEEVEEVDEEEVAVEVSMASGGGALCTRWITFPSRSVAKQFYCEVWVC